MMLNVELRIRCISDTALANLLELLKDESNAIFVESFATQEDPRTGTPAAIVYRTDSSPGGRLGSSARSRQHRTTATTRT